MLTQRALLVTLALGLSRLASAQAVVPVSPVRPVITSYQLSVVTPAPDGVMARPSFTFASQLNTGFFREGSSTIGVALNGFQYYSLGTTFGLAADTVFAWSNTSATATATKDTSLTRTAAGVIGTGATSLTTTGTDVTTVSTGDFTRQRYQATITPASGGATNCGTAFLAAALTADCTVATLPAGMKLTAVYADVTVGFTCSGTCTGTKVVQCGTAVNGTQILAANLNVATTGQFGLSDADLGSGMTRAAAIQGGLIGSWSSTTPVSCRFTSGTGNWGSGAATFVNAGSIKFTLITEQVK